MDLPLRFRPDLLVSVLPGEGVVLTSETESRVLTNPVFETVATLVDGMRGEDAIVDAAEGHDPAHVYYALETLKKGGHLLEDGAGWEPPAADTPASLVEEAVSAGVALGRPIGLEVVGNVPEEEVRRELDALGVPVGSAGEGVRLVLTDDYLHPDLRCLNEAALASGEAWFLAKPVGSVVWAGPWFSPGTGPCWTCLGHRILRNRPVESFLAVRARTPSLPSPPTVWSKSSLRAGVLHALAALGGERRDAVRTVHGPEAPRTHRVSVRPQCPACGDPRVTEETMRRPPELGSRPKRYVQDGGHRALPPEETVAGFETLVSPVSGVVDKVARSHLPGWDDDRGEHAPIHLFIAGGNHAGPSPDLALFRRGLRTWSGGKGATEAQARASALGEAIERYSGVFQGDEPRTRTSLAALGDEGLHPNSWMQFSDAQYRDRDVWNAHPSPYMKVPLPFDPDADMEWTPVWSMTHRVHRFLPTASLFYRYPGAGGSMCVADSNGAATGNTVEEAILQGFMELVERDAVALWWYNRIRRPALDLDALEAPYAARLRRRYRDHGRDLWVLDITSDLGIPCCAAVSRRVEGPRQEILIGLGAHFDPGIAASRAVTEVNQMLGAVVVSGAKLQEEPTATWLREATVDGHPYLKPAGGHPSDPSLVPRLDTDDLHDDVLVCQRLVEERGMEFLVQNQTRPDIGVPVVRVIVPGLRHFRPRYFPGRLYDVPVMLRWSDRPTPEEAMNPISFFL